jgi:hypothetical protein
MTRTLAAGVAATLLFAAGWTGSYLMAAESDNHPGSCARLSDRLTGFEALASDPTIPSTQRAALTADVAVAREWIDAGCSGKPPADVAALIAVLEHPQSAGAAADSVVSQTDAYGVSED